MLAAPFIAIYFAFGFVESFVEVSIAFLLVGGFVGWVFVGVYLTERRTK